MKIIYLMLLAFVFFCGTLEAQMMRQELTSLPQMVAASQSASEKAKKDEASDEDDGDGIEIGGPPPQEDFSTLSQEDAITVVEAAEALKQSDPELANDLLRIGKS